MKPAARLLNMAGPEHHPVTITCRHHLNLGRAHLLDGPRNDSPHGFVARPLHGVRLATASLAVGKEGDVVAVQGRLHKL